MITHSLMNDRDMRKEERTSLDDVIPLPVQQTFASILKIVFYFILFIYFAFADEVFLLFFSVKRITITEISVCNNSFSYQ